LLPSSIIKTEDNASVQRNYKRTISVVFSLDRCNACFLVGHHFGHKTFNN